MRKIILLFSFLPFFIQAQNKIERVEPPFWWTDMNKSELQVMLYGEDIAFAKPEITYKGVSIAKTVSVENDNYIFLYLNIGKEEKQEHLKFIKKIEKMNSKRRLPIIGKRKRSFMGSWL